jgi:hypothetical protein
MRFFLISTMTAIGLIYAANAESLDDTKLTDKTESSSKRTCRIVFPGRPNDAPKFAYIFDGRESHQVRFPSMNFSKVITLPEGKITLLLLPTTVSDPENLPTGAPQLKIKEDIRDFYILLSPDTSNSTLPIQMRLINTSDGKLKPGETLWFNLTDHTIVAKLGEKEVSLTPESETVSKDPVSSSGYYRAEFQYQPHAKGDSYRITEQHWWHDAGSRHLGFIVNTGGRLPKIYFYRDFRL